MGGSKGADMMGSRGSFISLWSLLILTLNEIEARRSTKSGAALLIKGLKPKSMNKEV
jgi:hypothetical protein